MKKNIRLTFFYLLRLGFGALMIIASLDKIANPFAFAEAVENYRIIGQDLSHWTAVWLPFLELMTGLLLISGIWLKAAVGINALLMSAFFIFVFQAWARGLDIHCGCFDLGGEGKIGVLKILENTAMAAGAWYLVRVYAHRDAEKRR